MSWHHDAQEFIKTRQSSRLRDPLSEALRDRIHSLLTICIVVIVSGCTNPLQPSGSPSPIAETATPTASPGAVPSSPVVTPTPSTPSPTATASPTPFQPASDKPEAVRTIETKLGGLISKQAGVTVQSIDCPATIEQKPGKTYDCQVTSDIGSFTVVVEPTGTGEQFRWGTKGLLLLSKLDEFIQRSAQSQGIGKVTVDCGGKVRPAKPGDTFECKVTDAKGRLRSTKVTVRDELGNVYISPL